MLVYEQRLYLKEGVDANHTLIDMLEAIELQLHNYPAVEVLVADIQAWLPKYNQYLKEGKTTVLRVLTQMYFQRCLDLFGAVFIRDDNRLLLNASENATQNIELLNKTHTLMTILTEWLVEGSYVKLGTPDGIWRITLQDNAIITEWVKYTYTDKTYAIPVDVAMGHIVQAYAEAQLNVNTTIL